MIPKTTPDLLELAEAVAAGDRTLSEAQQRLGGADAVELAKLVGAVVAVRAHAGAIQKVAEGALVREPALDQRFPRQTGSVSVAAPGVVAGQRVAGGRVRLGATGRRTPARTAPRWILVAAVIAVSGGMLAASGIAGGRPVSSPPASPANGVVTVEASSTATAAATPPAAVAAGREVLGNLDFVRMMSATVGWGRTYDSIVRTEDGGRTWAIVHEGPYALTRFVDETTAAFFGPAPDSVSTTHDGGMTWHSATLSGLSENGMLQLTFRSPDQGFATIWSKLSGALAVYQTTDGGLTWTGPVAGDESQLPSYGGPAEPQVGEAGVVWATPNKADNQPFDNRFSLSENGGITWVVRPFPVDPLLPAAEQKAPSSIRSDGADHLVMAVETMGIFDSRDDGRTWARVRTWAAPVKIELRSMTAWTAVAWSGAFVDATTDAGASWRHTESASPLRPAGRTDVSFGSSDVGAAVDLSLREHCHIESTMHSPNPDPSCAPGQPTAILMVTADGGRTWSQMVP